MTANNIVPAAAIGGQRPGTPGGASPSATPPQNPRAGVRRRWNVRPARCSRLGRARRHVTQQNADRAPVGVPRDRDHGQENVMTTETENTAPTYQVTWERVGRNHAVPPTTVYSTDPDDIAEELYRAARSNLASRDVVFSVDLEAGTVYVFAGFNNGGGGTIAAATR